MTGALLLLAAYLIGSFPTSYIVGRMTRGIDLRQHGSGNLGATNAFRVLGWRAGIPVLLIDVAKGFVPVRLLPYYSGLEPGSEDWMWLRVALVLATVIGHLYPILAGFRGGKGVATSLGGILAVHPGAAAVCIAVFAIIFGITRYVSLSSMCAAVAFPLSITLLFAEQSGVMIGFSIALCLLVIFTHRQNIGRLLRGEEHRMELAGRSGQHQ